MNTLLDHTPEIWNGSPAKAQGFLFVLTVAWLLTLLVSRSSHLCFSDTYGQAHSQFNSTELNGAATEVNLSQYVCKLSSHLSWRVLLISTNSTGVPKGRYLLVSFGQLTRTPLSDKSYRLWETLSGKSHTRRLLPIGGKQSWNAGEISTLSAPPAPTSQAIQTTSWIPAASGCGTNKRVFLAKFPSLLEAREEGKRRKESKVYVWGVFSTKKQELPFCIIQKYNHKTLPLQTEVSPRSPKDSYVYSASQQPCTTELQ